MSKSVVEQQTAAAAIPDPATGWLVVELIRTVKNGQITASFVYASKAASMGERSSMFQVDISTEMFARLKPLEGTRLNAFWKQSVIGDEIVTELLDFQTLEVAH